MKHRNSFLAFAEGPELWRKLLPYGFLLTITFALYSATLYFDFVWDDSDFVIKNYPIQGHSLSHLRAIWLNTFASQYAPLHHSFLALVYWLFGLKPFGYHLSQVLLHAACVCGLYFVLEEIESSRIALLASLLFAVYPANVETVAWVSETKSTLAFLFFLLSFWFFVRLRKRERWSDGAWCGVFLVLSLLSKVNTVVAPLIFLVYDYRQGYEFKKQRAWSLAGFFCISTAFIALQLSHTYAGNPASADRLIDGAQVDLRYLPGFSLSGGYYGGLGVHLLNLPLFVLFYLRMLFFPHPLAWHMFRVFDELNWAVGAAWIALLGLLWVLYRSPRDLQFWQMWFYIFLAPVLQIVPNPVWVADRYLYIPAIGGFVLLSKFFFYICDRLGNAQVRRTLFRLIPQTAVAAIIVVFAWQTRTHLPVWRNDLALWENTIQSCTASAFCHGNLARALEKDKQLQLAATEFSQAIRIRPKPQYFISLGDTYAEMSDYRRALLSYQIALNKGAGLPLDFWAKVARVHYLAGDLEESSRVIEQRQSVKDSDPHLSMVNTFVQWRKGRLEQARQSLSDVLHVDTLNPEVQASPAQFINCFWENPAEVDRLLTDLRPVRTGP